MKAPRNTTEETNRNPLGFLADAMAVGSSNAIELQESAGQQDFVNSDTLPTDCGDRAQYERMGIKFGEPVQGDRLFTYVQLPKGWKKVPTDHSMWSKLVDDKGRERAAIFYKAAFYDRSAHMSATRRFSIEFDYGRSDRGEVVSHVKDCGTIIYTTEPLNMDGLKSWERRELANKLAEAWLVERQPNWKDAAASWD